MCSPGVRLSIVVITWNERDDLRRCLEALVDKINLNRDEIIVVDNGSCDGSRELVTQYPQIRYLALDRNYGVAAARNHGLFLARGDICMTLDNDAVMLTEDPGAIVEEFFSAHPEAGVVGYQLLDEDGTRQQSARRFPKFYQPLVARMPLTRRNNFLKRELDRHLMNDICFGNELDYIEVDYVLGANQVFTKKVAAQLMGYDDNIFFGPEDAEFCVRVRKLGFRNYYCQSISIIHRCKRRTRKLSVLALKHLIGFWYMLGKHRGVYRHSSSISPMSFKDGTTFCSPSDSAHRSAKVSR